MREKRRVVESIERHDAIKKRICEMCKKRKRTGWNISYANGDESFVDDDCFVNGPKNPRTTS